MSGVNYVGVEGFFSLAALVGVPEISMMDEGKMDDQLVSANDVEGSWFWFIGASMV